jgi:nucleoid-associated protein YgaU
MVWLLPVVAFAAGLVVVVALTYPKSTPVAETNVARIKRRLNSLTATRGLGVDVTEHDNRIFIKGLVPDEARLILVRDVASEEARENVDVADLKTTPPAPPMTYTVRQGDSLWKIAKRKYGDGGFWPDIVKANPPRDSSAPVYVGDSLILPPLVIQPH